MHAYLGVWGDAIHAHCPRTVTVNAYIDTYALSTHPPSLPFSPM